MGDYHVQEFRRVVREVDECIRRRLRSLQRKKWKQPQTLPRMMIRAGYPGDEARRTWLTRNQWQAVYRRPVHLVCNVHWRWLADRRAVDLAGICRAVRRGWANSPLPTGIRGCAYPEGNLPLVGFYALLPAHRWTQEVRY
jgi:hypothetical protein